MKNLSIRAKAADTLSVKLRSENVSVKIDIDSPEAVEGGAGCRDTVGRIGVVSIAHDGCHDAV